MKLNPRLREYVQIDIRGNDVPGTNRYYKKQPRVGRWRELTNAPCCASFNLTATLADPTDDTFTVTVLCDAAAFLVVTVTLPAATTTLDEVISGLKKYASYVGKWSTDGTLVELQVSPAVAKQCEGELTLTVAAA